MLVTSLVIPFYDNKRNVLDNKGIDDSILEDNPPDEPEVYHFVEHNYMGGISRWEINKTFIKGFLKDNFKWRLQASNNNDTWYDADELLTIGLNWVDSDNSYKISLTLDTNSAPKDLYYRFDLAVNKTLKEYVEKDETEYIFKISGNSTIDLMLKFNFSDIKDLLNTGKVWFSKGVKDDFFWFRIQTVNKIPIDTIFVIDPSYGLIIDTVISSYEFDTEEGAILMEGELVRLNNSEYYMTSASVGAGTDYDGTLTVLKVDDDTGDITNSIISQWEYDISDGLYAGILPLENVNDTYIVHYRDATTGVIFTTRAFANDGTLQKTQIATRSTTYPHTSQMHHVTGDVYAFIYQEASGGYDYFLETYNIWSNGTISSRIDYVEFDQTSTSAARDYHVNGVMLDADTIAIVWSESVGADGWLTTYNISAAGDITNTAADTWEFDNVKAIFPDIHHITGDVYAIAFQDSSGDGIVNTTTIYSTGMMSKTWIDSLEFDTADCSMPIIYTIDSASDYNTGVYAITYEGTSADGFICTFNITDAGVMDSTIIDYLEFDTADSQYYCNMVNVYEGYFLLVYTGSGSDGWSKTVYIMRKSLNIDFLISGTGNWTVPENVYKITVLVVAGGGGSGKSGADDTMDSGGGGAGGLIFIENITSIGEVSIIPGNNISYSIGAGGAGSTIASSKGVSGVNTTFGNLTAISGGGGGSVDDATSRVGADGGSGGGGASNSGAYGVGGTGNQTLQSGWSEIYGFGNNGVNASGNNGGGGGGAGGAGSGTTPGAGKNYSSYFGIIYGVFGVFSEGGAGFWTVGYGAGAANSGNGGDMMGSGSSSIGSAGGSGIICIRYEYEQAPSGYNFKNTLNFNMSFSNTSLSVFKNTLNFNFSFSNQSFTWKKPLIFNMSFSNQTFNWKKPLMFNFSFSNTTFRWKTANSFNFSFSNQTFVWKQPIRFNMSFSNSTFKWRIPFSFNLSFSNTSITAYQNALWFNMSFSNTSISSYKNTLNFNMSFSNTSIKSYQNVLNFNMSFSNQSFVWKQPMSFNFSFSNSSINIFKQPYSFNMSFSNSTFIWKRPLMFNFSFSNTLIYKDGLWFNISFSNTSKTETLNFNLSFSNSTVDIIIISNVYPLNNSFGIGLQPTVYATFNNSNGFTMNVSWYYGNSLTNCNTLLGQDLNITNSTQYELHFNASDRLKHYYWRIQVDDGTNYVNETYYFKTEGYSGGYSYMPPSNSLWVLSLFGLIGIAFWLISRKRKKKK